MNMSTWLDIRCNSIYPSVGRNGVTHIQILSLDNPPARSAHTHSGLFKLTRKVFKRCRISFQIALCHIRCIQKLSDETLVTSDVFDLIGFSGAVHPNNSLSGEDPMNTLPFGHQGMITYIVLFQLQRAIYVSRIFQN